MSDHVPTQQNRGTVSALHSNIVQRHATDISVFRSHSLNIPGYTDAPRICWHRGISSTATDSKMHCQRHGCTCLLTRTSAICTINPKTPIQVADITFSIYSTKKPALMPPTGCILQLFRPMLGSCGHTYTGQCIKFSDIVRPFDRGTYNATESRFQSWWNRKIAPKREDCISTTLINP